MNESSQPACGFIVPVESRLIFGRSGGLAATVIPPLQINLRQTTSLQFASLRIDSRMTNPSADPARIGLLVSRDLFFTSKVTGTASALGLVVQTVPGIPQVVERLKAGGSTCACVFLDLGIADLDIAGLMAQLPAEHRPKVVAFGSHVATARLEAAAAAGCDEVLPRSRFSSALPQLLQQYLSEGG